MKKMLITICFSTLIIIGAIVLIHFNLKNNPDDTLDVGDNVTTKQTSTKDGSESDNKENFSEEGNNKSTSVIITTEIANNDKTTTTKKDNTTTASKPKTLNKSTTKNKTTSTTKKENVWDRLGLTEDQYFNQPMYSWEHVDFATLEECLAYGDKYEPYLNGEVAYNCSTVTSPSGKYLGEMFYTEKLR